MAHNNTSILVQHQLHNLHLLRFFFLFFFLLLSFTFQSITFVTLLEKVSFRLLSP
jgi:hypothetical protein